MVIINLGRLGLLRMMISLAIVVLSSCSYQGGNEHPVIKKFTWFSYVASEDIRKKCNYTKSSQYRFVYNGVYNEQVRTYDISDVGEGRYKIKINVTEEADVSSIAFHPDNIDLFRPWRPKTSVTHVSAKEIDVLTKTLTDIGFFVSLPPSINLPSISFYWVVSSCIDGKFQQNAYLWPEENFKKAEFPKLLSVWDFTDIPINPPRETADFSIYGTTETESFRNHFNLKFGSSGLLGHNLLD